MMNSTSIILLAITFISVIAAENNYESLFHRSLRNPQPECNLCPNRKPVIGDPEKYFEASTTIRGIGGTCKQFYETQKENLNNGGGGYSQRMCNTLQRDFEKYCKCVPEGTEVTQCLKQLSFDDKCNPNESDDQCCLGGCKYLDEYKAHLCTVLPGDPAPPTPLPTTNPTINPTPIPTHEPTPLPTPFPVVGPPTQPPTSRPNLPPPPPPTCNVDINIDITGISHRSLCEGRQNSFGFIYTGVGCNGSNNIQGEEYFKCKNFKAKVPILNKVVSFIRATTTTEQQEETIYFEDFVGVGDTFVLTDKMKNPIAENVKITIYSATVDDMLNTLQKYTPSPDLIIETMVFSTACNQNLFLKDSFGSLSLVSFANDDIFQSVTTKTNNYNIVVKNTGDESFSIESLSWQVRKVQDDDENTARKEEIIYDYPELVGTIIKAGEEISIDQKVRIETMGIREEYEAFAFVAATSPFGFTCAGSDFNDHIPF